MADAIVRLKVDSKEYDKKFKNAGKQLDQFKNKASGAGQFFKQFESKMGLSISSMSKFGVAAGAAAGALKIAKDALTSTESGMDSFKRETEAAKATYEGFVKSLNNGNFSGFLANIGTLRDAAKKAYNADDDLGTMTSFSDVDLQAIQTKRLKTQLDIKTGKANGENVQHLMDMLVGYDDEIERIAKEKADKAAESYEADLELAIREASINQSYYSSFAHKYADNWEGFKSITPEKIKEMERERDRLLKLGKSGSLDNLYRLSYSGVKINDENSRNALAIDQELRMIKAIRDNESGVLAAKQKQVVAEQELQKALQVRMNSQRYLKETGDSKSGAKVPVTFDFDTAYTNMNERWESSRTYEYLAAHPLDIPAAIEEEEQAEANGVDAIAEKLKQRAETYELCMSKVKEYNELMSVANEEEKAALQEQIDLWNGIANKITPAEKLAEAGNSNTAAWSAAANAMQGVGSALTSMQDPTAKVIGLIAQAVASVAAGAGQAISAKDTTSSGWAWIGAAAAITSEMVAIISTIKSSTSYHADGGIVGSNSLKRGTDTVSAMLTPGELVLNRSQQTNLANQLSGSRDMNLSATLRGEDIILAINNTGRRRRNGEYIKTV